MNILVVGATGLLGGRIAEYLFWQGHRVILGLRDFEKKSYFDFKPAEMLFVDLNSEAVLNGVLDGIELIICAAGLNSVDSQVSPDAAMTTRGIGTKKLIDAAVRSGVKKFIYISSAHVYKRPLIGVFDEKSPLLNENIYALSHRAGEEALIKSKDQGDIDGLILRVSNGFGRPVDKRVNCWNLLINDLCRQGIEGGLFTLKGDVLSVRNFISITEICRAINFCIENMPFNMNNKGTIIANLGGKQTLSILEVANIIKRRFIRTMKTAPLICFVNQPEEGRNILNTGNTLVYKSHILEQAGYMSNDDFLQEIDELIKFCAKNFR